MLATVMRKEKVASPRRADPPPKSTRAPARKQSFSVLSRKEKVNVVSKASLAMLNPRLAMGMESSEVFDSPDTRGSREWSAALKNSSKPLWNDGDSRSSGSKWAASPTPELEAFTMDDIVLASVASHTEIAQTQGPWVSEQFTDEPRNMVADDAISVKSRERKLSLKTSNGTLSRLFSWKKSGRSTKSIWNELEPVPAIPASYSASELAMPHSAPPTVTTFDLSGGPLQASKSELWTQNGAYLNESTSVPTSPVRDVPAISDLVRSSHDSPRQVVNTQRKAQAVSQYRLSRMQSLPSIRIPGITLSESDDTPAVPSLDPSKIKPSSSSPRLSSSPGWESTFGKSSEDCSTPVIRPASRYLSSTGRGVPSFSPNKFKDVFSPQLRGSVFENSPRSYASRRRSRSLGAANAPPRLSRFGSPPTVFSPASPNLGVFLPDADGASPEMDELTKFAAEHSFGALQLNSQPEKPLAAESRPQLVRANSTDTSDSLSRSSLEDADAAIMVAECQVRREDLTQRARAVPISSPSLSSAIRSPFQAAQSTFVVTVMPPTPDLTAEATPRMADGNNSASFDVNPAWVEDHEILVDNYSPPRRRSPRSPSDGSPSSRIKARRDTVVMNNTYAMPQYTDIEGLCNQVTPTMSYDYFDASVLQMDDEAGKHDSSEYSRGQRSRRNSDLSDVTEHSEMSSSSSAGGPFAFAHSLSQSTLAHSPSCSTLGSDSPRASDAYKIELLSPTDQQSVNRYKFASRGPQDYRASGIAALADSDSDEEDSELSYMSAPASGGAGLENDEDFKADATFAGMYLNANRLSVLSTTADTSSPLLDLAGGASDFGFELPPKNPPPPTRIPRSPNRPRRQLEAGRELRSSPTRQAGSDVTMPLFQSGRRPTLAHLQRQQSSPNGAAPPSPTRGYMANQLPEHIHALNNGHGFGINEPLLQGRSSREGGQSPVIVVPGGLNRVKSSKAQPEQYGSTAVAGERYEAGPAPAFSAFDLGLGLVRSESHQQGLSSSSSASPQWRPSSQESYESERGYIMAM
ncbi:hypothetical protein OC861_000195 [Tilletia horrida]|nr:hypothetical protein OC861_000195 [Tilletia horrida]